MRDRVVVITGGFGVLGRATADLALGRGARVVLVDRAEAPEAAGMLAIGGVDLTDPRGAARAFGRVIDRDGRIDALVNIAGGFRWQTLDEGNSEVWDLMYAMNLKTAVTACRAALGSLGEGGAIVNVGAGAALKAGAGMGAYAASKAGVLRLTESLAEELKDRGVRVNAVLPSIIDTPQNRADMPDADPGR